MGAFVQFQPLIKSWVVTILLVHSKSISEFIPSESKQSIFILLTAVRAELLFIVVSEETIKSASESADDGL